MKTEIMPEQRGPQAAETGLVFVYGTLRKRGLNDINRLVPSPVFLGAASIAGQLFDLGAYPGLLLGDRADLVAGRVWGEVYAIEPALERQLDAIEGIQGRDDDEYFRRHVQVKLDGHIRVCLVYEIHPARAQGRPRIVHGDWIQHVMGRGPWAP